jgi:amino acid transporter
MATRADVSERPAGAEAAELGEKRLSLPDVVAQSMGFVGPVFSAAFLIPLIVGAGPAGKGAGLATPLALAFTAIIVGAIGWVISRYARRIAAAGALYDYITHGLGREIGAIGGWVYYGGMLTLTTGVSLFLGGITADFLSGEYGWDVPYWLLAFAYIALVAAVLYFGVRISTRAQLALVLVSMLVIVGFMLYVIAEAPAQSARVFDPGEAGQGWSGIFYGIIYAILVFVGFETAANLAEETRNPKRNVPLAIFLSLGLVGAYYVLVAYAQAVGFGLDEAGWAQSGAPIFALASPELYGSSLFSKVVQIIVILDVLAVMLGCWVAMTHGLFALGRDGRIPSVFARVDPRRGTPVVAIGLVALLTVTLVLVSALGDGVLPREFPGGQFPEYFPLFAWLAAYGGFSIVCVYATICLGALRGLWGSENPIALVVAVAIGVAGSIAALYGAVYKVPEPGSWAPWFVLGWFVIGAAVVLVLRATGRLRPATGLASEGLEEGEPIVAAEAPSRA